jgi:hypothetical protein
MRYWSTIYRFRWYQRQLNRMLDRLIEMGAGMEPIRKP